MAAPTRVPEDVGAELLGPAGGACLPPCQLTEEDASAHPGLTNLLLGLTPYLDLSGLSAPLARQLEQAGKELQLRRAAWLRWEALHRLLQEALMEQGAGTEDASPAPPDRKFLETLEQRLLLGELSRILEPGPSLRGSQPPLLGLGAPDLLALLPPSQDLARLQQRLPQELEERLRRKGLALLSYHRPESDRAGETARCAMLWTLAEGLAAEQRRRQAARSRRRDLMGLLERQRAAYPQVWAGRGGVGRGHPSEPLSPSLPQVLLHCLGLLQRLAQEHRLGTQAALDRLNTHYLEVKCSAMFLKIRLEELSVLVDTYSPEKVEVHRAIRASLQGAVQQQEQELATARKILAAYESLGPEFEGLVQEYAQLCGSIENKRWALQEFSKGCH
ncbi:HAUS augmin-like complex subunit 4 isoform X1 [Chelonia mydas]|uniref:HAUS augmin-like complex subunit 4 isoform X1 n=1 Tax=Chelonia mydas TaxID=8469 RepID=UPI001CA98C21|nr:HAUS augmin-like complex subunit 4 isoform X1 [Chelonia mydas]